MFQDISQSLVLIAFVWGPLVYAREHNGTLDVVQDYKGVPCVCESFLEYSTIRYIRPFGSCVPIRPGGVVVHSSSD